MNFGERKHGVHNSLLGMWPYGSQVCLNVLLTLHLVCDVRDRPWLTRMHTLLLGAPCTPAPPYPSFLAPPTSPQSAQQKGRGAASCHLSPCRSPRRGVNDSASAMHFQPRSPCAAAGISQRRLQAERGADAVHGALCWALPQPPRATAETGQRPSSDRAGSGT